MRPRFFVPTRIVVDEIVRLPSAEARHLRQVLRLGVGDTVGVFDGQGHEFIARVEQATRQAVSVRLLAPAAAARESTVVTTLAAAVLKGRQVDGVVSDATMLGVAAIQPLLSRRTTRPSDPLTHGARERWRRIAVASSKQCGRAVVPDVRDAVDAAAFAGSDRSAMRIILVEPGAVTVDTESLVTLARLPKPGSLAVAVGPEGGWAADELAEFTRHGFQPATLGSRTLRADAVPAVALAVLLSLWGEL